MLYRSQDDTIVALSTAPGMGAIAVVRVSGAQAIEVVASVWRGKSLRHVASHTVHFGTIVQGDKILDEVVVTVYRNPRSYTGEDVVEIACHGSVYIQQALLGLLQNVGARMAEPGEFTLRAYLNRKMDLAQAEAVGDLIASTTAAAQQTALNQMRGGFSHDLQVLRDELIHFAAMIELELDFAEEDVDFADREKLIALIHEMQRHTQVLVDSFQWGNVIKHGISVAIIGKPNAGKSTLLNALLNEERAIVSDIAGTTRDTIEERVVINGVLFRLIDTAGIRSETSDTIEQMGIERSKANAEKADIIIHLRALTGEDVSDDDAWLTPFEHKCISVWSKYDVWRQRAGAGAVLPAAVGDDVLIAAPDQQYGIETLKKVLYDRAIGGQINTENTIVTNARHQQALLEVASSLRDIEQGLHMGISGDLLALDIRRCLHYLGDITGAIDVDRDVLGKIFSSFCIGK